MLGEIVKCPTPSEIRARHEELRPQSHFFSRGAMKFFGDTMRNFGSFRADNGAVILYRKHPVKHGLQGRWIFDEATGEFRSLRSINEQIAEQKEAQI
jgi:hypothetical protein